MLAVVVVTTLLSVEVCGNADAVESLLTGTLWETAGTGTTDFG